MKTIITDTAAIHEVVNRINAWVKQNTQGNVEHWIEHASVTECAFLDSYRFTCGATFESREVRPFTRSVNTPLATPATITKIEDVDPWTLDASAAVDGIIDIPGSFSTVACPTCKGKGRLVCPECRGQKGLFCTECHGDGKIACPSCRKTRKVACERCKGHGRVYNEATQAYDLCPTCQGKGGSPCTVCGDGYVECPKCGGNKKLPCKHCHEAGDIECSSCAGNGHVLSGLRVEILRRQEQSPVPSAEPGIPKELAAIVPFETMALLDPLDKVSVQIPSEVSTLLACVAKPQAREGEKSTRSSVTVDRQRVCRLSWGSGAESRSIVFADIKGKLSFEPGFITLVYAGMIADLKTAIAAGNIPAATALLAGASGNAMLAGQLAPLAAAANHRNWLLALAGGLAGAAAGMAVTMPLVYRWRAASLHLTPLLVETLLICLAAGAFSAVAAAFLLRHCLAKKWQRLAVICVAGMMLSLTGYGALRAAGLDPARAGDRQAAEAAYKAYFPFGLRTLASKEDIAFLEKLIATYEPTGIDMALYKKDLIWLKEKIAADAVNLKKVEQAGRALEQAEQEPKNDYKVRRSRKKSKIYIQ